MTMFHSANIGPIILSVQGTVEFNRLEGHCQWDDGMVLVLESVAAKRRTNGLSICILTTGAACHNSLQSTMRSS